MNKLWKYIIYAYLVVAVVFIVEAILNWNTNRERSYLLIVFAILTILLFFFKQNFRKKIERRNNQR